MQTALITILYLAELPYLFLMVMVVVGALRRQRVGRTSATPSVSVILPAHDEGPTLPRTLASLAAQRYSDAQTVYELLIEQNPSDTESLYNLGWALFSQDRRAGARDAWVASCEQGYQPACTAITTYL